MQVDFVKLQQLRHERPGGGVQRKRAKGDRMAVIELWAARASAKDRDEWSAFLNVLRCPAGHDER